MKLVELAAKSPNKQIAKVFESYFEQNVNFDQLAPSQARKMLNKVKTLVREHRSSPAFHRSEQNPAYLKLVMMEQALYRLVQEQDAVVGAVPQTDPAKTAGLQAGQLAMKKRQIQDQIKTKQKEITDLQKAMNNPTMMAAMENNTGNFLRESEVQQAQVVLAAQDMVDKMQGMLEDTTEMQFKELPALVDSIRNQIGMQQANQFNSDATAALSGLVQNLQGAKQQLETALGVVTGQAPADAVPGLQPAAAGAELGAQAGADLGAELGADLGAEAGADLETGEVNEPVKGPALGRGRR